MSGKNRDNRPGWSFKISSEIEHQFCEDNSAGQVAAMFGLSSGHREKLYENFCFDISPGQILAVIGPSGAGKSVLLQQVKAQTDNAESLGQFSKLKTEKSAVELIAGDDIKSSLAMLARCGLAEATVLVTPAGLLSGGQKYRLALAMALQKATLSDKPKLILADEFCSTLDVTTAAVLCRQMRKLISRSNAALLVATPRVELLDSLRPDAVIVKPMGSPAKFMTKTGSPKTRPGQSRKKHKIVKNSALPDPRKWPIVKGRLADYRKLEQYHYITGPPACNKRVYVIRTPEKFQSLGASDIAAVLIVSPPVISVRGRNVATFGRYVDSDRRAAIARLNSELETISRVVVHPAFRGCGLACRLVRHAIKTSPMPILEALAAMGKIHPVFVRAGMKKIGIFKGPNQYYHYYIFKKDMEVIV